MENSNNNRIVISNPQMEEETIDLLDLARALWSKVSLLIVAFAIGATVAFLFTMSFIQPQYEAQSMIYVYGKTTSITSLADLQIGSQLTVDFKIIATTREVIESAAADIGLNQSYEAVVEKVTIDNPDGSRILEVKVRDTDPVLACNLSNSIANQLRLRIAEVMNTDEPSTVENAIVPIHPVSPNIYKNTFLGGFGLLAVVAAIIVIMYLLDDSIKTEEDVEKYLRHNVLAVVPVVDIDGRRRRKRRKASSKPATGKA